MERLRADSLSERQRRILDGLVAGKSNGVLAQELGITLDGVKWHVSQLLWDTGCADRHALADWWRREQGAAKPAFFFGLRWPSGESLATPVHATLTLVLTVAIVAGIYAGWTCTGASGPRATRVSALGKVAYVRDGDVWVKDLPDGDAHRVTAHDFGDEAYVAPKWSPSGQWLLAYSNAQAVVMRADGTSRRVYDGRFTMPVWSPVADRLAFAHMSDGSGTPDEILVEDAEGSDRIVAASATAPPGEHAAISDVSWSPDGLRIAYAEHHWRDAGASIEHTYEAIRIVAADGSAPPEDRYVEPAPPEDRLGILAYSGQAIVFYRLPSFSASASADGVQLLRVGSGVGAAAQALTDAPVLIHGPLYAFDRGNLAVTGGAGRESWTNKQLAVIYPTGAWEVITDSSAASISPAWEPDGARIAYSAMPDAPGLSGGDDAKDALAQRKIWIVGAGNPAPATPCIVRACYPPNEQLTFDRAYRDEYPQFSVDGREILFARLDGEDRWSLWLMPSSGGTPQRVVDEIELPSKGGDEAWFGYYGVIAWHNVFDWWRPRTGA
jgi:Tol biopolymer transport system component/DNA-binding CsgD family transcriptional regulator